MAFVRAVHCSAARRSVSLVGGWWFHTKRWNVKVGEIRGGGPGGGAKIWIYGRMGISLFSFKNNTCARRGIRQSASNQHLENVFYSHHVSVSSVSHPHIDDVTA